MKTDGKILRKRLTANILSAFALSMEDTWLNRISF